MVYVVLSWFPFPVIEIVAGALSHLGLFFNNTFGTTCHSIKKKGGGDSLYLGKSQILEAITLFSGLAPESGQHSLDRNERDRHRTRIGSSTKMPGRKSGRASICIFLWSAEMNGEFEDEKIKSSHAKCKQFVFRQQRLHRYRM